MSVESYFKTLGQIEDRVSARMTELRQAERDVALHCGGMAFDGATAADVYRAGLDHVGVPRRETAGLSASELRVILKNLPRSGAGGATRFFGDGLRQRFARAERARRDPQGHQAPS
jgi:hypothetical protein